MSSAALLDNGCVTVLNAYSARDDTSVLLVYIFNINWKFYFIYMYVIDPHPKTDPSPYSGKDWAYNYSRYRQPRTYDERVVEAKAMKSGKPLSEQVTVFVDDLRPHPHLYLSELGGHPGWGWGIIGSDAVAIRTPGFGYHTTSTNETMKTKHIICNISTISHIYIYVYIYIYIYTKNTKYK